MSKKGPRGELEVRDLVRAWWRQVEPDVAIERTPRSGGWHAAAVFRASGDLMVTPGSSFPFSVEVKYREAFSFATLLASRPSPVWGWWAQCRRDAEKVALMPLLFFRKNRQPWHVMAWVSDVVPEWFDVRWRLRCPQGGGNVCVALAEYLFRIDPRLVLAR